MNHDSHLIFEAYQRHNIQTVVSNTLHMAAYNQWDGVEFYLQGIKDENPDTLTDVGYAVRSIEQHWDKEKVKHIIDIINTIEGV